MKNSFYSWGFVSGVTDLKNPVFVFTKHFLSWEFLYIWGYSSGSFLIFQDTKLHIWGNSCSLTYRKQEGVVALYGNDLPHCLPRPFSKLINLCTVRQFFWPSEQIFQNFLNSCLISSYLLEQVSYDTVSYCPQNVLKRKLSQDFLWHLKSHQIYFCQWFSKNHPIF